MLKKKLLKDNISRIGIYEPGLPIEAIQGKLAQGLKLSKLASNENPLGPSPLAVKAIRNCLKDGHLYPDNSCSLLKKQLAGFIGISPDKLCVGNGTTELIFFLGVIFLNPGETLIMSQASFVMAKMVAQVMDSHLVEVPLKDYKHDPDAILKSITHATKIVYFDNPMNPIGTMLTREEVARFMARIPEDVIVIFDEAYYDYADHKNFPDTIGYIQEGRNVIALRTFSKLYGLAGFRVGYCAAREEFIEALNRVSPPFAVNRFAQIAAAAALADKAHVEKTKKINQTGKRYLYENLNRLSVFYVPSETNFITIDVKRDAVTVFEKLLESGVLVRPLTMYGLPTFIRVTVGTLDQNRRFIQAFKRIYHQQPNQE